MVGPHGRFWPVADGLLSTRRGLLVFSIPAADTTDSGRSTTTLPETRALQFVLEQHVSNCPA